MFWVTNTERSKNLPVVKICICFKCHLKKKSNYDHLFHQFEWKAESLKNELQNTLVFCMFTFFALMSAFMNFTSLCKAWWLMTSQHDDWWHQSTMTDDITAWWLMTSQHDDITGWWHHRIMTNVITAWFDDVAKSFLWCPRMLSVHQVFLVVSHFWTWLYNTCFSTEQNWTWLQFIFSCFYIPHFRATKQQMKRPVPQQG